MKRFMLCVSALALVFVSTLFAQTPDITGTWQGTLKTPNRDLRLVYKISKGNDGSLKAVLYNVDQAAQPIPANSVKMRGSAMQITITALGAYDGNLSSDGNTIAGTWTQVPTQLPLNLTRATPETAWAIPDPPLPPKMMDPNARPEFEVASIKPSDPDRPGWMLSSDSSGRMLTHGTTLSDLINFAYSTNSKQVVGAPGWADSERFDVEGKPGISGIPDSIQMKTMLQKLLVDRFAFTFHKDKRDLSAYVITVAKGGAKIQREENAPVPKPGFGGQPQFGFNIYNATMAEFARCLQAQFMDLPVIDQTELGETRYTFVVKFTPDPGMHPFGSNPVPPPTASAVADPDAPPDLFIAMEQQAGLHMQKTRASVDVIIIDKVEKPSPN